MRKVKIYIGTSGWHYKHWIGTFYPEDLREKDQLDCYINYFDTVEINNSFYHLPASKTFTTWKNATPPGFLFSVKANRYLTHMKKLKPDAKSIRKLFTHASRLDRKLGPVLFQLPPHWKINTARLEEFLQRLPLGHLYTFEFRNHTWYEKEVYEILKRFNVAFCIYELEHHISPLEITADFVYVRLHGPENKYQGKYSERSLKKWAKRCIEWQKDKINVFLYFDNDQNGYAAFNAQRLNQLIDNNIED